MSNSQLRFYDVMEFFNDDERVAALALVKYNKTEKQACEVYNELLSCHFARYVTQLEEITESINHIELKEWVLYTIAECDTLCNNQFNLGDMLTLERTAWKLTEKEE